MHMYLFVRLSPFLYVFVPWPACVSVYMPVPIFLYVFMCLSVYVCFCVYLYRFVSASVCLSLPVYICSHFSCMSLNVSLSPHAYPCLPACCYFSFADCVCVCVCPSLAFDVVSL